MLNQPLCFFMSLFALAGSAPGGRSDAGRVETLARPLGAAAYADARSFLTDDDVDRWYDLTFALRDDFDDICGDTFCEGDYNNYESLSFSCSVDQGSGILAECVWVFAASIEEVDPVTGRIDVQGRTWRCQLPLAPDTPLVDFLQTLTSSDDRPLFTPLPASAQTPYDGLIDCL